MCVNSQHENACLDCVNERLGVSINVLKLRSKEIKCVLFISFEDEFDCIWLLFS